MNIDIIILPGITNQTKKNFTDMIIMEIKKLFSNLNKNKKKKMPSKALFQANFFTDSNHDWIISSKEYLKCFTLLFEFLDDSFYYYFETNNKKLLFHPINGHLSSALNDTNEYNIILIYPELLKILKSASHLRGIAVLAHEIGHIILNHSKQTISKIEAQLEADNYVIKIGLGEELIDILSEYKNDPVVQTRIKNITSYHHSFRSI